MSFVNTYSTAIHPTDARIYYENGVPYMEYKGITHDFNNDKCEVYLHRVPLTISALEYTDNLYDPNEFSVTFTEKEYGIFHGKCRPVVKTIERTMTKAQIEKELGYKVNIVDK